MFKSIQRNLSKTTSPDAVRVTGGSTVAAFLMMFQIYMVAPIIDDIANSFYCGHAIMPLIIPAMTIPLGLSALLSGKITSYLGERNFARGTVLALAAGSLAMALSPSAALIIVFRVLTGLALGGLLPLSFRFIAQNFPISNRFFPVMIIVFGMAGGMTFGPVLGAICLPYIGWRTEFLVISILCLIFFFWMNHYAYLIENQLRGEKGISFFNKVKEGKFCSGGSLCILIFILLNGVFHSGLFVWTSGVLTERYHLGDIPAGMLLLDFGLPGLLLVVMLGFFSKSQSSIKLEFTGLAILALCIMLVMLKINPWMTFLGVALLSIGYNITQPLFFGIVGRMANTHKAQVAVQLGCCFLFVGYGLGPLIFGWLMSQGSLSSVLFLLFLTACLASISRAIFQDEG